MRKDLYLSLQANDSGTQITITEKYTLTVRVFLFFWFGLLLIFTVMALIAQEYFMLLPLLLIVAAALLMLSVMHRFAENRAGDIRAAAIDLLRSLAPIQA